MEFEQGDNTSILGGGVEDRLCFVDLGCISAANWFYCGSGDF